MKTDFGTVFRRHWVELTLVLAVFAAATGLGAAALRADRIVTGQSSVASDVVFFARSAMFASGRGFFHPAYTLVPGLKPFLQHETKSFDPASLPNTIMASDDEAAEYHIYLEWLVGAIWRVFGISWPVLEPLLAFALGLCAVCVYGLCRLGMNRWLSLGCVALFVSSPAVLDQLKSLRDFSKAPFLLCGLFAIGWLVTRRAPLRFPRLMAALMGMVAGVGMGFRQDAFILVPATLATILFLSHGVAYQTFRRRAAAALVYVLAFLAAAAPMLTRMEGGAQPYHPLAQGYSMKHMDRCSLESGLCEPLASAHDNFVFATIFSYARRATGDGSLYFNYSDREDMQFTRDWVIRTALQFPADTIARGYGAVLNVLCNADGAVATLRSHRGWIALLAESHRRIAAFFRLAGVPIALLALLAATAATPRLALTLTLIMFYFCGYVSLDNEWRHTFHLSFVCFWAAGFLLQLALSALVQSVRGTAQWGLWLRRAGVYLVLGALVLWTPWQAACFWQRHNVERVMDQYAAAPRFAAPTQAETMQDLTLFRLKPGTVSAALTPKLAEHPVLRRLLRFVSVRRWETDCTLYAVRLRSRQAGHLFLAKYWGAEETGAPNDYAEVMRVAGAAGDSGETWFYFPVYEFAFCTLFEGVAFPQENAGDFLGLYRVENGAQPVLMPCTTINEQRGSKGLTARLRQPYDLMQFFTPENEQVQIAETSTMAENAGRTDTAVFYARIACALNPTSQRRIRLAEAWEKAGRTQETLQVLESAIVASRGEGASCGALENFFERNTAAVEAPRVWKKLAERTASAGVWRAYEKSLNPTDIDERLHACRQLQRITPNEPGFLPGFRGLLTAKADLLEASGDIRGAVDACREAVSLAPADRDAVVRLEKLLSKMDPKEALGIWEELWKEIPDNPLVALCLCSARAVNGNLDGARQSFAEARRMAPKDWNCCEIAAKAFADVGAWVDAVGAYECALTLNPGLEYLRWPLEDAQEKAGQLEGPLRRLETAILSSAGDSASCSDLEAFLKRQATAIPAAPLWRKLADKISSPHVWLALERALDEKDIEGRMDAYRQALRLAPGEGAAASKLQELLIENAIRLEASGDLQGAVRACREAIPLGPENNQPVIRLEELLSKAGPTERRDVWEGVWKDNPGNPLVAACCGRARVAAGDLQGALTLLRDTNAHTPADQGSGVALGQTLEVSGDDEGALAEYRTLLAQTPESPELSERIDAVYRRRNNPPARVAEWKGLAQNHADAAMPQLHLGMALEEAGDTAGAEAPYRETIRLRPDWQEPMARLGALIAAKGNAEEGLGLLDKAVLSAPELALTAAEGCGCAAKARAAAGDFPGALALLRKARILSPADQRYRVALGETLEAAGDDSGALSEFRTLVSEAPESAEVPHSSDRIDAVCLRRNDPAARVAEWRSLVKEHPDASVLQQHLGMALEDSGDSAGAELSYREAIRLRPEWQEPKLTLGALVAAGGNTEEGLRLLDEAVRTTPGIAKTAAKHCARAANALFSAGNAKGALALARRARSLAPEDLRYRISLGELLEAAGDNNGALEEYRAVVAEAPESPKSSARVDAILEGRGDKAARVEEWNRMTAQHPGKAIPQLYLGFSLEAAGDRIGARQAFAKALEINPALAEAHTALDKMGRGESQPKE